MKNRFDKNNLSISSALEESRLYLLMLNTLRNIDQNGFEGSIGSLKHLHRLSKLCVALMWDIFM